MSKHPQWATKFRAKGTELRLINGKYYLYECSSIWDKEKKRSKKVSGKLLGRITEKDGFIESDKNKLRKRELTVSKVAVKESGFVSFIKSHLNNYITLLEKHFPQHYQTIIALTYCRLAFQSPLKNAEFHYLNSYLSEIYPNLKLAPKQLTQIMKEIGVQRDKILAFFKEFNPTGTNIIFDGTDIFCNSKNMDISQSSRSKKGTFDYLANIMFAYSTGLGMPIYYKVLPGNIKDIKAFRLCIEESSIKDAVVIIDKGFFSKANIQLLLDEKLSFIIPLKRNNPLIDYNTITSTDRKLLEYFMYEKRVIWYYTIKTGTETLNVYLDEELKTEEIKDYLRRIESLPETHNIEKFHEIQHRFGTISLFHNTSKSAKEVFTDYKNRGHIEKMIETLKNVLEADSSYMHNEQSVEAWMFINYLSLHWYYKLLDILKKNKLNSKYSPMDFVRFLQAIKKVKINESWQTAEITKKYADILTKAGIPIT